MKTELYHHGILGQKWGVRNGPPYPLDESQYSGKERMFARTVNEMAPYRINYNVTDKALKELGKTDEESLSRDERQALLKIEQDIRNRPDFQELVNMSYNQTFEDELFKARMESGKRFTAGLVGTAVGAVLAYTLGSTLYKKIRDR